MIWHNFGHVQACSPTPTWNDWIILWLLCMSNHIKNFSFTSHLFCEMLQPTFWLDLSTFVTLWLTNFIQKNQRKQFSHFWDPTLRRQERTDEQSQIHGRLPLAQVSNKEHDESDPRWVRINNHVMFCVQFGSISTI